MHASTFILDRIRFLGTSFSIFLPTIIGSATDPAAIMAVMAARIPAVFLSPILRTLFSSILCSGVGTENIDDGGLGLDWFGLDICLDGVCLDGDCLDGDAAASGCSDGDSGSLSSPILLSMALILCAILSCFLCLSNVDLNDVDRSCCSSF
jgi:hypothetical protein